MEKVDVEITVKMVDLSTKATNAEKTITHYFFIQKAMLSYRIYEGGQRTNG